MKYMLDTNIIIYLIKNKPKNVLKNFTKHKLDEICISSITFAELIYGVEKSVHQEQNRIALYSMLSNVKILNFNSLAAEKYGNLRAKLEHSGSLIGPMDLLIASHALAENLTLVTNNISEFVRVQNLKLENWVE